MFQSTKSVQVSREVLLGVVAIFACFTFIAIGAPRAFATALPATINSNMTLVSEESPYESAVPVTISEGVTLTVEPGVTIKAPSLQAKGTLLAEGTGEEPVVFTSVADSAPGQWEGIGLGTEASVLENVEIRYATTAVQSSGLISPTISNSTIHHSSVAAISLSESNALVTENSLSANARGIRADGGGHPEIVGNTIKDCDEKQFGILYEAGSEDIGEVEIRNNEIEGCGASASEAPLPASYAAISVYGASGAEIVGGSLEGNIVQSGGRPIDYYVDGAASTIPSDITENAISENEVDAIWVAGLVAEGAAWKDNGFPIVLHNGFGVSVANGAALSFGPGLVVKAEVDADLDVKGELIVEGDSGNPATITSIRDDSVGGDTNADDSETAPGPGDWGSVRFAEGTSEQPEGRGDLVRLHVSFGGDDSTCEGEFAREVVCEPMVALNPPVGPEAEPSVVEHSAFNFSATEGLGGTGVSPEVSNSHFLFNRAGMIFRGGGAPVISDNEVADCAIGNPGIAYRAQRQGGEVRINGNSVERCGGSEAALLSWEEVAGIEVYEPALVESFAKGLYEGVTGVSFSGNTVQEGGRAISYTVAYGTVPSNIDENTISGNRSNAIWVGGLLEDSAAWENRGFPIVIGDLASSLFVDGDAVLTVGAGLALKMERDSTSLGVAGELVAQGASGNPVVITSIRDDSVGGDTNGDAEASLPSRGDWHSVHGEHSVTYEGKEVIDENPGRLDLDHVAVRFGGSHCEECSPQPMVAFSDYEEKTALTKISKVEHSRFEGAAGLALAIDGEFSSSELPTIKWNRFLGNGTAVENNAPKEVHVPHNDFGSPSGPRPVGTGDRIGGNVDPNPWTTPPSEDGPCRGEETQCPEDGDPVSLATGQLSYQHLDLLLMNRSASPLEFSRFYNSADTTDTGLGIGWSTTTLMMASELEDGDVLVRWPDGHEDVHSLVEESYEPPSGVTDHLLKEEDGTFTLTTLGQLVYRFDDTGRLISSRDQHALETAYEYDVSGRLASIADSSEQSLEFTYNVDNRISAVADSTGRAVSFTYSEDGELETVTDPLEGVTRYGYDARHRLTTITDPRENVFLKNVYDEQGRIIEQEDALENLWILEYKTDETIVTRPEGGAWTYKFDSQSRQISEEDPLGAITRLGYDARGHVDEISRPGGADTELEYDPQGNVLKVTEPEGRESKYTYNSENRPLTYEDPRGGKWAYEWEGPDLLKITDPLKGEIDIGNDSFGLPVWISDQNEHVTEIEYDIRGNPLTVINPLEDATGYEYDERGYLTGKTSPGLEPETFYRGVLGEILSRTTPEGNETAYGYDANGFLTSITDPGEGTWIIERDPMERATAYIDPLEQRSEVGYDGNLRPISVTDRRGKETTYAYDLANQLTEIVRPEGGDWEFGYDARGNRVEIVDPRENASTYEFDLLNRMTKAAEPLEATTSYEYDPAGSLTLFTDPDENTTGLVYDDLGRLTEVDQPLGKTTTFTYDGVGNRLTRTTASGTIELGYDAADRLEEISTGEAMLREFAYDPAGRMTGATDAQADEIEVGYDDDGRVISIDDGRGQAVSREYDSRGNLVEQTDARGTLAYEFDELSRMVELTDPQSKVLDFGYDPEGNLTSVELPNGIVTTNEFDNAGRLAETTSEKGEATLESLDYAYDPSGNRVGQVDRLSRETSYEYDALNRLVEFDPPGEGSTAYDYDPAGNRTEAGVVTYGFNDLNQLTSASNGTTYDYDNGGRLVEVDKGETSTTYSWNVLDELTSVDTGAQEIEYAYDALGRQVLRDDGSTIRPTHYGDLSDLPIMDADAEGEPTMSYVQGPEGLIEQRSGETTSFPLRDAHGDVTTLADGEGEVASRQTYDPWGAQLSGPTLEMGWLGAQQRRSDPATELVQMGIRSYGPVLGRFVAEDPVLGTPGESQSLNRYPYAWDNPINLYDLDGREVCAGLGPIQGCVDSDGPSISVEPCLHLGPAVSGCVGSDGPKVCVGSIVAPIKACEDPETAAKYGKTCSIDGATGAVIGLVIGQNIASAISGAAFGCGAALIEKMVRRLGEDALADDIDTAGKAWDVAEILCFVSRKC